MTGAAEMLRRMKLVEEGKAWLEAQLYDEKDGRVRIDDWQLVKRLVSALEESERERENVERLYEELGRGPSMFRADPPERGLFP